MKLLQFKEIKSGAYLNNYELTYLNSAGQEKIYEIVSHHKLDSAEKLGQKPSGVSIIATQDDKLLLLHEFRMGINRAIYNLCAGMLEPGETIEACIARELYEETGLAVKCIKKILPPSFSAVAISDITTYIAFVETIGCIEPHCSANEQIHAQFYTRNQVLQLLETEPFSSRAQMAAYYYAKEK